MILSGLYSYEWISLRPATDRTKTLHNNTCLMALWPGQPGWTGTRKVKPIWIYWSKKQWVAVASAGPYAMNKDNTLRHNRWMDSNILRNNFTVLWKRMYGHPVTLDFKQVGCHICTHLHEHCVNTHRQPFYSSSDFVRDNPGELVHFAIFWIFWCKMKITQADAPTIRIDCYPI